MKILIVSQHYYPENFRITDIAENLVKLGHSVTVLSGYPNYPDGYIYDGYKRKEGKKHKKETINGVSVIRCFELPRGKSKFKLFLNYYSICLSLKRKAKKLKDKFDLVFINQLSPVMQAWAGIFYAKKRSVPCLLYCYDLWPDSLAAGGIKEGSLVYKYFYKVSNKIYRSVDKILCTSKGFIPYFVKKHGIDKEKLEYLPQYCEDMFTGVKQKSFDGTFDYVFAGNVGNVQSVETIIKAANEIKDQTDVKIHIVGDGSDLNKCKSLVEEYRLKNVVFYGKRPLDEMPKFYEMADAMLLTLSKNKIISNTLPGKAQSYMASGKPIIGAIDGEANAVIKESGAGLCCDSEDYKSLSKLFLDFRTCDRNKMSENSRKYYEENFKKDKFFDKLNSEFKEITDERI